MAGHTPGPWKWHSDNCLTSTGGFMNDVLIVSDDGAPYGAQSPLIEHHHHPETAKANKALIAAAPDLLAACKAAKTQIQGTDPMKSLATLQAAIAKAEPEAT